LAADQLINFFIIVFQISSEYIEGVFGCREDQVSVLWVETQFFHVRLALMEEHQLGWNFHSIGSVLISLLRFIFFYGEVP
jgi:hypothetical protein